MQTQFIGLMTPLIALFFAAMFVALWRVGRMERYVLGFGLAFGFSAIGYLITHFAPADGFYVFHTTHLFYSLATIAMVASVCERAGRLIEMRSMVFVYVVTALALAFAVSVSNDVAARLVIVNTGYGIMCVMGAATLLSARPTAGGRSIIDILIIALLLFHAADFLVRPTLTLLFERSIPAEVYRDSVYYWVIGFVLSIKGIANAAVLTGATVADWVSNDQA